jgi:putative heme-binding domain-containing protein
LAWFFACGICVRGQTPQWIWHQDTNVGSAYFRKSFRTPPLIWNARLTLSADDNAEVFLNGVAIARCESWDRPLRSEVTVRLNQGENVIAVQARNSSGPAGLLVHLNLGGETNVVSDSSWLANAKPEKDWNRLGFNASHWQAARVLGEHGIPPWGEVLQRTVATSPEAIEVPEGFKVELLRSAQPGEGSWICLTFDDQGRLIISPEGDQRPLLRLTLRSSEISRIEQLSAPLRYAMGLLHLTNALYANARGPQGAGLYRAIDKNGNDQYEADELEQLKKFEGGSEHGYHALRLGPDGKLYVLNGNGTKVPAGLSPHSPHRNYRGDVLSPSEEETKGDGEAPSGYILRTDLEGKEWELWMGGLRNSYDFDFHPDGESFVFDSDMEWDWGTPWYRPTRVLHCVSGAEYGWREEIRMWPSYYEDSFPPVVEVGIGSPTGVKFGTKAAFPEKYRRAMFIGDWSYGRIMAVQLEPKGASYNGKVESFLRGTPLNVTDLEFGPDGAMYFITGGRATQSGLYRVSYTRQKIDPTLPIQPDKKFAGQRDVRRKLEALHGRADTASLEFIWKHLGSEDRTIRYAARIALESLDFRKWQDRALSDSDKTAGPTALLGLARAGGGEIDQRKLLEALRRFPLSSVNEQQKLIKLRAIQLSLIRQGPPEADLASALVQELSSDYPARSFPVNREMSRILLSLNNPEAVPKTVALLEKSKSQEEQIHYVALLRHVKSGWTLEDRRRFFSWWTRSRENLPHDKSLEKWFADVGRHYVDGAWVDKYMRDFRADAVKTLSGEEKRELAALISTPLRKAALVPSANRQYVREWKMEDFLADLDKTSTRRNLIRGRHAFVDAQCLACHRFGNDGGTVGPELTAAGSKYDARSLLESILEPSRVINEQYASTTVVMKDGESYTGRLVRQDEKELVIETDLLSGEKETLAREQVERVQPSQLSSMPQGLVNILTREEVLDLISYLQSGGLSLPQK